MSFLDAPSAPNPSSVPNRPLAIRYGGIWGGVSILVTLVAYLTNTDPALPTTGPIKWVYSLISYGIAIWAITMAIKTDRDQQLGGYISLSRCVGLGSMTGLIAGAIASVFTLLYMTVINPGFAEQMKEAMAAAYEDKGMSEEQIEMSMGVASFMFNPVLLGITVLLGTVFMGLVIGLIAGAIMKKERPYTAV